MCSAILFKFCSKDPELANSAEADTLAAFVAVQGLRRANSVGLVGLVALQINVGLVAQQPSCLIKASNVLEMNETFSFALLRRLPRGERIKARLLGH